jgi:hypothetical protein
MPEDRSFAATRSTVPCTRGTVTDLASRRRCEDLVTSISFVFGGVHYGTFPLSMPYTKGKPLVLYVVPSDTDAFHEAGFAGSLECLITDDDDLALDREAAR